MENDEAEKERLALLYQKKTLLEHMLALPDTYIGSISQIDRTQLTFDNATGKLIFQEVSYIPALIKLFDECIVNCRDQMYRIIELVTEKQKHFMSTIKVTISPGEKNQTITIFNDGDGIDVCRHPIYTDTWIPELILANPVTSTNFNKEADDMKGGKNGYGVKLVLVFSNRVEMETVDATRGLKYTQVYEQNLNIIHPPVITHVPKNTKPYFQLTYFPDYPRFGIEGLSPETIQLLQKRTMDIAAISENKKKKLQVFFNDNLIPCQSFKQYLDLMKGPETILVYENVNPRWEFAVFLKDTLPTTLETISHVSFVNGIATKSGTHVDYIMNQCVRGIQEYIEKKKKTKVSDSSIRNQLLLVLRCDIVIPCFGGQAKDEMSSNVKSFGSTCELNAKTIEKIASMGDLMDRACNIVNFKADKKASGTKKTTLPPMDNLIDAHYAGRRNVQEDVTLYIVEGDSAKSGAQSGLPDTDFNGILAIKGKIMNVRNKKRQDIQKKDGTVDQIVQVLGLTYGKEYLTMEDVRLHCRYNRVKILCDADNDGKHITYLLVNMFACLFPSLLKIPGFLWSFVTPIIIATHQNTKIETNFYNKFEYHTWKLNKAKEEIARYDLKYYKGLGTSVAAQFKQYFLNEKNMNFVYTGPDSEEALDKLFNGKRAHDRKLFIMNHYNPNSFVDTNEKSVTIEDYGDKEMIHFSQADCDRSIPSVIDGLKTSQRKALFAAFKRRLKKDVKVASFAGYVAEHSQYHHGETSLCATIIGMGRQFVGSNNVNLFFPAGQFGTRLKGGADAASPRYVFTRLETITRFIYPEADDAVLNYLEDEGMNIEPEFYVPIIPMILVNGAFGMGTGFLSDLPTFNVADIVKYLQNKLKKASSLCSSKNEDDDEEGFKGNFVPFYEGFTGTITRIEKNKYLTRGIYKRISDTFVEITELPIGKWSNDYTLFYEGLVVGVTPKTNTATAAVEEEDVSVGEPAKKKQKTEKKTAVAAPPVLKSVHVTNTDVTVHFLLEFRSKVQLDTLLSAPMNKNNVTELETLLKLTSTLTSSMYFFNKNQVIQKYDTIHDIIDAYYEVRLALYEKRKAFDIEQLRQKVIKCQNKSDCIRKIRTKQMDLSSCKTSQQIDQVLTENGFVRMQKMVVVNEDKDEEDEEDEEEEEEPQGSFNYLTSMKIDGFTEAKEEYFLKELEEAKQKLQVALQTSCETIWLKELNVFEAEFVKYKQTRHDLQYPNGVVTAAAVKPKKGGQKRKLK